MNCDQFRMSIAERLDGELEAPQAQEFDAHAKTCQGCHYVAPGMAASRGNTARGLAVG